MVCTFDGGHMCQWRNSTMASPALLARSMLHVIPSAVLVGALSACEF